MELPELQANVQRASSLLKALSNEHRLLIMCQLVQGERSVGELVRLVGLSQSALSQHLARLRRDQLVRTRRSAQTIYYSLAGEHGRQLVTALHKLYADDAGLAAPEGAARGDGELRRRRAEHASA